jgi:amidase
MELGHQVVEDTPKIAHSERLESAFITLWTSGTAQVLDFLGTLRGSKVTSDLVEPLTWAFYEKGRQNTASAYLQAVTFLQRASREIARFFVDYDVWLTPTLAEPPVPLGTFDPPPENPWRAVERMIVFIPFTWICNFTGQPAMSVPLFWNSANLPIGTHFIGRFGDEATLFRLAAQLEETRPWATRRPPIRRGGD